MKKLVSFSLVMVMVISFAFPYFVVDARGKEIPSLKDIEHHWAGGNVAKAVEQGWINGYMDQTFKPNNTITRAEFTKAFTAALQITPVEGVSPFTDNQVEGGWYIPYLNAALQEGILVASEYPNGQYEPTKEITREEIATMVVRALKKEDPAKSLIQVANELGIMKGYEDGSLGAEKTATRAEAVVMILRSIGAEEVVTTPIKEEPPTKPSTNPSTTKGITQKEMLDMVSKVVPVTQEMKSMAKLPADLNARMTDSDLLDLLVAYFGYDESYHEEVILGNANAFHDTETFFKYDPSRGLTKERAEKWLDTFGYRVKRINEAKEIADQIIQSFKNENGHVTMTIPGNRAGQKIWVSVNWIGNGEYEGKVLHDGYGTTAIDITRDYGHLEMSITDTSSSEGAYPMIYYEVNLPDGKLVNLTRSKIYEYSQGDLDWINEQRKRGK